jgi:hypothetical protein
VVIAKDVDFVADVRVIGSRYLSRKGYGYNP